MSRAVAEKYAGAETPSTQRKVTGRIWEQLMAMTVDEVIDIAEGEDGRFDGKQAVSWAMAAKMICNTMKWRRRRCRKCGVRVGEHDARCSNPECAADLKPQYEKELNQQDGRDKVDWYGIAVMFDQFCGRAPVAEDPNAGEAKGKFELHVHGDHQDVVQLVDAEIVRDAQVISEPKALPDATSDQHQSE